MLPTSPRITDEKTEMQSDLPKLTQVINNNTESETSAADITAIPLFEECPLRPL